MRSLHSPRTRLAALAVVIASVTAFTVAVPSIAQTTMARQVQSTSAAPVLSSSPGVKTVVGPNGVRTTTISVAPASSSGGATANSVGNSAPTETACQLVSGSGANTSSCPTSAVLKVGWDGTTAY